MRGLFTFAMALMMAVGSSGVAETALPYSRIVGPPPPQEVAARKADFLRANPGLSASSVVFDEFGILSTVNQLQDANSAEAGCFPQQEKLGRDYLLKNASSLGLTSSNLGQFGYVICTELDFSGSFDIGFMNIDDTLLTYPGYESLKGSFTESITLRLEKNQVVGVRVESGGGPRRLADFPALNTQPVLDGQDPKIVNQIVGHSLCESHFSGRDFEGRPKYETRVISTIDKSQVAPELAIAEHQLPDGRYRVGLVWRYRFGESLSSSRRTFEFDAATGILISDSETLTGCP